MLNTLIKIGEQISQNIEKWDDKLENRKNKLQLDDKGNRKKYVLNIIFDIDNQKIIILPENLEEFSEKESTKKHWLLKTFSANNPKTYVAALFEDTENLKTSLIEKIDKNSSEIKDGDFINDINKKYKELKNTIFYKALESLKIFKQKAEELDPKYIKKQLNINEKSEIIIFCYCSIINSNIGISEPKELSQLEGFEKYMTLKFFSAEIQEPKDTLDLVIKNRKLCYATGELKNDVSVFEYQDRSTLSSMFVHETKNYATNFAEKYLYKNFQTSEEIKKFINRGANFIQEKYTTKIAGINHIIIPTFLNTTNVNIEFVLTKIKNDSDFIFNLNQTKKLETDIKDEIGETIFWINYFAIDVKKGQSLKTIEIIKDINSFYFKKIRETFNKINEEFNDLIDPNSYFNFYTLYRYIPVRDNSNTNIAFNLFKNILEQRPIENEILFKSFSQYLICQLSGQFDNRKQHRSYSNIIKSNFDFAIANAVNTYLLFFELLKRLNLLKQNIMEENKEKNLNTENKTEDFGKQIELFFENMNYKESQKALFYLGRILNQIGYAQIQKNHKTKPILNKINYNGIDIQEIKRLYTELFEKARQYNILDKTEFNFSKFTSLFNPNDTKSYQNPQENVFYILSGYSFGISRQQNEKTE